MLQNGKQSAQQYEDQTTCLKYTGDRDRLEFIEIAYALANIFCQRTYPGKQRHTAYLGGNSKHIWHVLWY